MIILLTIFQYLVQAGVDVADKFLISKRKIEPFSYTFYTIAFGILIAVVWPWVYFQLPGKLIALNMLAGGVFALAYYVLYKALSQGEVSRVVPFVFGILPVADFVLEWLITNETFGIRHVSAMTLLIPGALLIAYKDDRFLGKHVWLKILAAVLLAGYNMLWHMSSQTGPVLNSLIWNRVGALIAVLLPLALPMVRHTVFRAEKVKRRKHTSVLFLLKQAVGGGNFILLSYLLSVGSVSVVDSLQGFRYVFLFIAGLFLSRKYKHILEEDTNRTVVRQKLFATALIALGTIILFL